jgi:NADP-dependent 3-hydroxy acid dehydrogenase YdfG
MGGEIVRELASTHDVVAVGRNLAVLRELAAQTGCRMVRMDLTHTADLVRIGEEVRTVDVLVHAAAIARAKSVADADADDWRSHLEADLVAPALLTRALLPALRRSAGSVVFIGSGASTRPIPGSAVYTAAKHALKGMADVLRIDEQASGLRVVTVAPGQTDTEMLRSQFAEAGLPYEVDRYIRPASVAAAVRFVVDAPADVQITDIVIRPRVEIARL